LRFCPSARLFSANDDLKLLDLDILL